MEAEYTEVFDVASQVYRDSLFRLPGDGGLSGRRSVPLADAVLIAFSEARHKRKELVKHSAKIVEATRTALQTPEQYELLVGRGNTKQAIEDRLTLMKGLIAKAAWVIGQLGGSHVDDSSYVQEQYGPSDRLR